MCGGPLHTARSELEGEELHHCQYWGEYNYTEKRCECGSDLYGIVHCKSDGDEVSIGTIFGYCVTLNNQKSKAVVGACPHHQKSCPPRCKYYPASANITKEFCNDKRTGQLCGKCSNGYSSPVYSYYDTCVRCKSGTNNWPKYLAISLLPETVFLLVLNAIRFRSTSPNMNGYILMCQVFTSGATVHFFTHSYKHDKENIGYGGNLALSLLSIWNLDFFKLYYIPFCLHPSVTTLQVISLEYLTALYPLLLILLTYTLVRLHYKNYRLVVCLWRPFARCFAHYRRQCDIQNSLVDAFATFLLLSYVKLMNISLDLLTPTVLWNTDAGVEDLALYYDGTVQYFRKAHIPYALLAITVLVLFNIMPIFLFCFYPCICFQRMLNTYNWNSSTLHFFMNSFQGCFKDGTNGTRDCRWFSAFYLFIRIALHFGFMIARNSFSTFVLNVVILGTMVLLACIQPYKNKLYCKLDVTFLAALCVIVNTAWELHGGTFNSLASAIDRAYFVLVALPLFYQLWLIAHYAIKRSTKVRAKVKQKLKMCCVRHTASLPRTGQNENSPLVRML